MYVYVASTIQPSSVPLDINGQKDPVHCRHLEICPNPVTATEVVVAREIQDAVTGSGQRGDPCLLGSRQSPVHHKNIHVTNSCMLTHTHAHTHNKRISTIPELNKPYF